MSNSIHADASQTVRISARRFEPSPFHDCYANAETVLGVYAGRFYAVFNGEDNTEAYWTLRRKAVLYDVPEKPITAFVDKRLGSCFIYRIIFGRCFEYNRISNIGILKASKHDIKTSHQIYRSMKVRGTIFGLFRM